MDAVPVDLIDWVISTKRYGVILPAEPCITADVFYKLGDSFYYCAAGTWFKFNPGDPQ